MIRRMFSRCMAALLCLLLLPALTVRAEECAHQYQQRIEEPTCEIGGVAWHECILCGKKTGYTLLDPKGHEFEEWYVLTEPTCGRDGVQARDCMVCGYREEAPIPHLGHDYTVEVLSPTCTARGYTRSICTVCRDVSTTWDYVPALGHSYDDGVLLREPTETTKGHVLFSCIRCRDTYQLTYAFRDIDADSYYFTPVIWAVNNGITSGMDETHFSPDGLCNRAQVVTFLWRAAGRPIPTLAANPFQDVPKGCYYEQAVLWAYESGITRGTAARRFSPDLPCTRAQVVTFLHRSRGCPEPTGATSFPDVDAGSFYHKAVLWAAQRGITTGMDGGFFRPELSCSRAQIVTFLYRDAKNP